MRQMIDAAEIVYLSYGYYPNDSGGGATCPRDIVIAPGITWGKYMDVCEDPYGKPYQWNNLCSGLNGSRNADNSNPNCPAFSNLNEGRVGVMMSGEDGVGQDCSGDDVCFGVNGYSMYGFGDYKNSFSCQSVANQCAEIGESVCEQRSGCSLGGSGCSGEFQKSCSDFSSKQPCQNQSGCSWNLNEYCSGIPPACSSHSTKGSCQKSPDCIWGSFGCSGIPRNCSSFVDKSSCNNAECNWTSIYSCQGQYLSQCNIFTDAVACQGQVPCLWNSAECSGTAASCSSFQTQSSCSAQAGCSWQ